MMVEMTLLLPTATTSALGLAVAKAAAVVAELISTSALSPQALVTGLQPGWPVFVETMEMAARR